MDVDVPQDNDNFSSGKFSSAWMICIMRYVSSNEFVFILQITQIKKNVRFSIWVFRMHRFTAVDWGLLNVAAFLRYRDINANVMMMTFVVESIIIWKSSCTRDGFVRLGCEKLLWRVNSYFRANALAERKKCGSFGPIKWRSHQTLVDYLPVLIRVLK